MNKDIESIKKELTKAISLFRKKKIDDSLQLFTSIVKNDSADYAISEVCNRAQSYINIIENLKDKEKVGGDNIAVIYHLNEGNVKRAQDIVEKLLESKTPDSLTLYLASLVYFQNGDKDKSMEYLKETISLDKEYRILASNEPDFSSLKEDGDFKQIIE